MSKEITKFKINMHHRYDLRDWLTDNFPFLREKSFLNFCQTNFSEIRVRASEIVDACMKVEKIDLRAGSAYIDYYKQDWMAIKEAYEKRDYEEMTKSLKTLIDAIDVE